MGISHGKPKWDEAQKADAGTGRAVISPMGKAMRMVESLMKQKEAVNQPMPEEKNRGTGNRPGGRYGRGRMLGVPPPNNNTGAQLAAPGFRGRPIHLLRLILFRFLAEPVEERQG